MKTDFDINKLREDTKLYMMNEQLNSAKFCSISGINRSTFSRFINSKSVVTKRNFRMIVDAIGTSYSDYITTEKCIYEVEAFGFNDLSIEKIDELIEKLKELRYCKIKCELDKIETEQKLLSDRQQSLETLLILSESE